MLQEIATERAGDLEARVVKLKEDIAPLAGILTELETLESRGKTNGQISPPKPLRKIRRSLPIIGAANSSVLPPPGSDPADPAAASRMDSDDVEGGEGGEGGEVGE